MSPILTLDHAIISNRRQSHSENRQRESHNDKAAPNKGK